MKTYIIVFIVSLIPGLAGCGNKAETTTGGASADLLRGENTIATDSGGLIYAVYDDRSHVDEIVRFKYAVRNSAGNDQSGTLHWDDNSSSRVRGNGFLKHIYRAPGTYTIAIQPDGEEKLVVGTVFVLPKPDCPPLVIPAFDTTTGFPSSIPRNFEIKEDGNCYDFAATNAGASFSVESNSTGGFIDLITRTNIFLYTCSETTVAPFRECWVPSRLGGTDGNSGVATFPSNGSKTCTGFVRFTGDVSSLVVSSDEITINCQ